MKKQLKQDLKNHALKDKCNEPHGVSASTLTDVLCVSDKFINELFAGTNFGESINNCVEAKRKQLAKTLRDQVHGYWSGHTAYHIAVDGGFLKDAKSGETKILTALGWAFIQENT